MASKRAVLIYSAVVLVAHTLVLAFLSGPLEINLSNGIQLAAASAAALFCVLAGRRSGYFGSVVWGLTAAATGVWVIAEGWWAVLEAKYGATGVYTSPTDVVFFFSFAPLLLILLTDEGDRPRALDGQRILDLLQIGLLILCAYVYLFYLPGKHETMEEGVMRLKSSVYGMRNILLAGALWFRAGVTRSQLERSIFARLATYLTIYAVSTRIANYARSEWGSKTGTWFDLLWVIPFLALAYIAATWKEPAERRIDTRITGVRGLLARHLVPALIPVLILLMAAAFADTDLRLASVVIVSSFALYSFRLAVTQYRQHQASEAAVEAEKRFGLLFTNSPLPAWVFDYETLKVVEVNEQALSRYGYSREEFIGLDVRQLRPPEDVDAFMERINVSTRGPSTHEVRHQAKSGEVFDVYVTAESLQYGGRRRELVMVQDVTERKRLESQLRHAQKMEAVGTLAGGIAHDFNNLLTVISGYSQVILDRSQRDEQLTREIQQIEIAANRASGLVRQLLAFSRRQVLQPQFINLETVVSGLEKMLRRMVGEHISLRMESTPGLRLVKADPSQIEQVLVNLVVNARDALDGRSNGDIVIRVENVSFGDEEAPEHHGVTPGQYVRLTVIDNGCGMDEKTQERIFEPFFTTKKGTGTGLGLATVYGIVQQSGGQVAVASDPGRGAHFFVYLPQAQGVEQPAVKDERPPTVIDAGSETVLVVEDDDGLRELTKKILRRNGYKVLDAARSSDAEMLCRTHEGPIHLLLTDVVMPGMSGKELAELVQPLRPDMRVLFMSGYAEQVLSKQGMHDTENHFLQKPFTPGVLSRRVREILDEAATTGRVN